MIKQFLKHKKSLAQKPPLPQTINISGIDIEVTKKHIKNMHMRVRPPYGTVHISAPILMSDKTIRLFVVSKITWIRQQMERCQNQVPQPPIEYISGETHYLRGKPYQLEVVTATGRPKTDIHGTKIILAIRPQATCAQREKLLNAWYREQLTLALPPLFEKWEPIIGVHADEVKIKDMHTRWGTCNTLAKRIWISLNLVKKSPQCLEYVVVHELVHLLERSHNNRFKTFMDNFLPDWRTRKETLNRVGEDTPLASGIGEAPLN